MLLLLLLLLLFVTLFNVGLEYRNSLSEKYASSANAVSTDIGRVHSVESVLLNDLLK